MKRRLLLVSRLKHGIHKNCLIQKLDQQKLAWDVQHLCNSPSWKSVAKTTSASGASETQQTNAPVCKAGMINYYCIVIITNS